jgi:hypothetical protein
LVLVVVAPSILIIAAAWIAESLKSKPQFSLRTLLIGMTLVAVSLAVVVWAVK